MVKDRKNDRVANKQNKMEIFLKFSGSSTRSVAEGKPIQARKENVVGDGTYGSSVYCTTDNVSGGTWKLG